LSPEGRVGGVKIITNLIYTVLSEVFRYFYAGLRAYPKTPSESEKDGFYGSEEGFFFEGIASLRL
jgi:hypothetical protein